MVSKFSLSMNDFFPWFGVIQCKFGNVREVGDGP